MTLHLELRVDGGDRVAVFYDPDYAANHLELVIGGHKHTLTPIEAHQLQQALNVVLDHMPHRVPGRRRDQERGGEV